jgi:hypothetical protein
MFRVVGSRTDILVLRPQQDCGSITTLLLGFVYACATMMKVCLVSGFLSAVTGLGSRVLFARDPVSPGTFVVLGAHYLVPAPFDLSVGHFSQIARTGVLTILLPDRWHP